MAFTEMLINRTKSILLKFILFNYNIVSTLSEFETLTGF
jgi:hypothetical protein